jgi:nucleoid DNA-binding protein
MYSRAAKVFDPPLTRADVTTIIDILLDGLTAGLTGNLRGEDEDDELPRVLLRSFGTFKVVQRKGRTYRVRGKDVEVGDRHTITFNPGAELTRALEAYIEEAEEDGAPE